MTIPDHTYIRDLCRALDQQNQSDIQQLLTVGQDYNIADNTGKTPLYYAAAHHDYENVEKLLWSGARPDHGGTYAISPLLAVMQHATDKNTAHTDPVMLLLLQAGADPNKMDNKHETALMHAKTADQIKHLIQYKADVNQQDVQQRNILHHLLNQFNKIKDQNSPKARDILQSLTHVTKANADIYQADQFGNIPFDMAMQYDNRKLQQIFLNARTSYRQNQRNDFNKKADKQGSPKQNKKIQKIIAKRRPTFLKRRP